ncbi:MAG TPA: hypothetical protein VN903_01240, partial [Polyangia bacterium]|nr:hypothetical protein [Polyangia bacterium]
MASNTKIGLTNYIASATLMNGSGGGAPALIQTSPYTMSNLVGSDRYKFWMSSALAASSAFNVDFDLGANRS